VEAGAAGWLLAGAFCAAALVAALVDLALELVSAGLDASRFAFEEMTKRRRAGAGLPSDFFVPLLERLALLDADAFRFNINYKTQMIRFSSEKSGRLCPANAAAPTNVPSPTELREIAYTRRPTPSDTSCFCSKFKDNRNCTNPGQTPLN